MCWSSAGESSLSRTFPSSPSSAWRRFSRPAPPLTRSSTGCVRRWPPRRWSDHGWSDHGHRRRAAAAAPRLDRVDRVDLYEYQAKDLFGAHGVPVLPGRVVTTAAQARAAAAELGGAVVVKAQVKTGGRGKAGGVQLASTPDEAQRKAAGILGMDIKGHRVHRVLVTPACEIAEEYYLSFLLDRAHRTFLAMASVQGGMDIEEVAATAPEALAKVPVDPRFGVDAAKAAEIIAAAAFPAEVAQAAADTALKLWEVFVAEDATLVEVNPLVRDTHGSIIALDGKVTLDDNAAFRHPGHAELVDSAGQDPLEAAAKARHLN